MGALLRKASDRTAMVKRADDRVNFNISGRIFCMSTSLVRAHPDGRLAIMLEEVQRGAENGSSRPEGSKTIFVDGPPERFQFILDWYRNGEIWLPGHVSTNAVLQDARWFWLPDEISVNGVLRQTNARSAHDVRSTVVETVLMEWPGFSACLQALLLSIDTHFRSIAAAATSPTVGEETYDFASFVMPLCGEAGWLDNKNVCNGARARVLALRLEEHGYLCEFTETDLVVSLQTQLRGEALNAAGDGMCDEEEGEEVGAASAE